MNARALLGTEVPENIFKLRKVQDWFELAKNISNLGIETQEQADTSRFEVLNTQTNERLIAVYFKGYLEQINIATTDANGFESVIKIFFQTSSSDDKECLLSPVQIQLKKTISAQKSLPAENQLKYWVTSIQEFNNDGSPKILTNHGRGKTNTALYIQSSSDGETGNQSFIHIGRNSNIGQSLEKDMQIHQLILAKGHTVKIRGNAVYIGVGEPHTCTLELPENLDFSEYISENPRESRIISNKVQKQSGNLLNSLA